MSFNHINLLNFQGQTAIRGVLMLPKSSEVRFAAILDGSGELGLYSAVFQEDQAFPLFKISDIQAPTHQYVHCISFWVEESLKTFFFFNSFISVFINFSRKSFIFDAFLFQNIFNTLFIQTLQYL